MKFKSFLYGAILGAIGGILFAPEHGRRTRALLRDKAIKYSNDTQGFVQKKSTHLANKAKGYSHYVKEAVSKARHTAEEEMPEETTAAIQP